jgi:hypothetical protein
MLPKSHVLRTEHSTVAPSCSEQLCCLTPVFALVTVHRIQPKQLDDLCIEHNMWIAGLAQALGSSIFHTVHSYAQDGREHDRSYAPQQPLSTPSSSDHVLK